MKPISIYFFIISTLLFLTDATAQAPNSWTQKANLGGLTREYAVGFNIGNKGYIGTGLNYFNIAGSDLNDFWQYNITTNVWTQKANFGGGLRERAVGFSIGAKGYIGTGMPGLNGQPGNIDFWEYDTTTNVWTRKADFGGGIRQYAVGFSIGNKGYIGTGAGNYPTYGSFVNDFWEYDPSTDSWTQKSNFGGAPRIWAVGFSIGTKGYIGTGRGLNSNNTDQYYKDFWEYDPSTDTWTQKADFGGTKRTHAVGFGIGNKGYLGTGVDTTSNLKNDFWEYDPLTNTWTVRANFGGTARAIAVGFCIGSKGYIGTGHVWSPNNASTNDFWEYTTTCVVPNTPTNTTPPANQNICSGNSTILSASGTGTLGWYSTATGGTWLGGGSNYTTPILTTNTTYYVQDSTCAASTTRTAITVTVNAPPVPTILGQTSMCINSGYYNYTSQAGMINYVWTVSPGGVINYGSGTNQIQVSWICAGNQTVSVTYANAAGCNALAPAILTVTVNPLPGQAGAITGVSTVCAGDNDVSYSIAPIPNTISYVWVLPLYATISSGAGTNSITVNFDTNSTSGNVSVNGNNLCGNGPVSPDFPVMVNPLPPPPIVTNSGDTLYSNAPNGNQWYYEGILLANDTSMTCVAHYNGYYWDEATVNGCTSDTSNHILILLTGVNSHSTDAIRVYPIPADGMFNISIRTSVKETYSIMVNNILGIKVYEEAKIDINGSLFKSIDLRSLPGGVYTMIFGNSYGQEIRKIIISK
jgi:N-acetylneuraminic acid mutarotase